MWNYLFGARKFTPWSAFATSPGLSHRGLFFARYKMRDTTFEIRFTLHEIRTMNSLSPNLSSTPPIQTFPLLPPQSPITLHFTYINTTQGPSGKRGKINQNKLIMQNEPNFRNVQRAVTAVMTMTNNNEPRTMNYSKQTQNEPNFTRRSISEGGQTQFWNGVSHARR